ncbi:DeoR/GlpR family DNA-binding transcription regulator [Roseibium sp. RKSG952]|uniref:DeoR/GlpR family DNA-binding transcription regulator n=1 Tax=Roseibium sp. RKSG952 TaxID=2529384 RepID=UPI0012BC8E52|nr:DeoR/GlpR family DNA-binding transcription regulator [Roseibium sp. RKSG952]MTH96093.1 DeoR/GlpR transcriptional regulator [Roseibium sp. RKSG952]
MTRKEKILEIAQHEGRVLVERLADDLSVSSHTIRRDINALCKEAKLRRLHGGAEFIDSSRNVAYDTRSVLNLENKRAIAEKAAGLVHDGATVFLSVGTTPALVAEALAGRDRLTLITNNLNAAMAAAANPDHRIIVPGGEVRLPDRDFVSETAVGLFSRYRADFAVFGVGGIDSDGSLLDFHETEVRLRQQMRRNSRCAVLVADHTKFGRRAAAVGGDMNDADIVVIDCLPGPAFVPVFNELSAQLLVAQA